MKAEYRTLQWYERQAARVFARKIGAWAEVVRLGPPWRWSVDVVCGSRQGVVAKCGHVHRSRDAAIKCGPRTVIAWAHAVLADAQFFD